MQVFVKDIDKDTLILLGARASRVENQDAIDACIVGMLGDPKEVCLNQRIVCRESKILLIAINKNFLLLFAGQRWHHRGAFSSLQSSGQAYGHNIH